MCVGGSGRGVEVGIYIDAMRCGGVMVDFLCFYGKNGGGVFLEG